MEHRVAILEDHQDTLEMLDLVFRDDYEVHPFSDTPPLLQKLEHERFDLILSDLFIGPEKAGLGLLHHVRSRAEMKHTPVVLVSAVMADARVIASQFDAFVPKPFKTDELLRLAHSLVHGSSRVRSYANLGTVADGNQWLVKQSERMLSESRQLVEMSRVLKLRTDEVVRQTRRDVFRKSS